MIPIEGGPRRPCARESTCIFRGAQYQALHLKALLEDRGLAVAIHSSDPFITGFYTFEVWVRDAEANRIRVAAAVEQFEEKLIRSAPYRFRPEMARRTRIFCGISLFILSPLSFLLIAVPLAPVLAAAGYTAMAIGYFRAARRNLSRIPPLTLLCFVLAELMLLFVSVAGVLAPPRA